MKKIYLYVILLLAVVYLFKNHYKKGPGILLKDHMEGKESETNCEGKPISSDYKKAWTEDHVSKNTKYYTSDITDEKTDTGMFFNKNNEFVDITSYKSKDVISDKCFYENGVLNCQFNDKLQNIPPSLIEDPESNPLLLSIGDDKNINTNKLSEEVFSFNGNSYNVWDYGKGSSGGYNNDSTPLKIDGMKKNYAL